jgi:crotonobetainyl-CoA:carnitine CoA-transferase CaiB-like acyl-CoA transferase
MAQPLHGIKVVELAEGIAGPYAGKLLADYGADVVKVESPSGDRARHLGPFPAGVVEPDPEQSALFLHLNTNKRSVVAGPADDIVHGLLAEADLVLQSEPLLAPDELRALHPGLSVVTVTSFGLTGPYAGYAGSEIIHYALGGPMSASGDPNREPLKMGADLGQYQCGSMAALAGLAAVMVAETGGRGVHVDLANVETQVASIDRRMTYLLYAAYRGEDVPRFGGYSVAVFPGGCRPAADGHVQVSTLLNWLPRMHEVIDDHELRALYDDPTWFFSETLPEAADSILVGWTLSRTKQEAMEQAQAKAWPVTAVNTPLDVLADGHFAQRRFFRDVDHPVAGVVRQPGAPIRMVDGWQLRRPAPLLGEHTAEVTSETRGVAGGSGPGAAASTPRLPLDGIRVLDLTVVWAGPYATQLLGDLGADVIRVDNPYVFPSATRGLLPRPPKDLIVGIGGIFGGYPDADPGARPWNRVALFNAHARNKRSITLDLRKPLGRESFLRLAERCDVVIENNSVDLVDKLGIGWADLHARNPRLVMVRLPSVGLEGPYRDYLGFGVNFEALCGLNALRGYRDADASENEAVFHMDAASGSAGALATLMALRRRQQTGQGELVEVSQSENMLNHIGELLVDAARSGAVHGAMGNRDRARAPQGCYPCTGNDAWAVISIGSDREWEGLRRAMGNPDWAADPRFATADGRHRHHDDLDDLLAGWTGPLSPGEVFARCQAEGVPAAPVLHDTEALADPHLRARGMFRPNGNDEVGTHDHPAHAWHWDGPSLAWGPLPVLGGDNEAVLRDVVGLNDEEYAALAADGHLSRDYLTPDGTPM